MTEQLTNWAGTITFQARRLHRPSSVEELQELVAQSERVRALGTGHSFNPIADSPGDLVSLAGLPRTVEIDRERGRVTIDAGIRYGDLAVELEAAGYALPNLASLPHISVVGACATGTHGSGERNGNLATSVAAVEMVTADGELVTLSRDSGDERFNGAVVSLGALGIVTKLTLDVVPTFQIRQYVYENLPRPALEKHWDEIFGSAYSVSLFTDWRGTDINQVWLKQRVDAADATPPPAQWLGAVLADGPRHPIPGMPVENCTEQMGVAGPWHVRLPHFRLEFTPSNGEEMQSEYMVPRHLALEALEAISQIRDQIAPLLQICEIRAIAADELWMSPNYQRDTVAFHFTWVKDPAAVTKVVAALEERLAPLAARPHWGKVFTTSPEQIQQLYARWSDFRDLMNSYDPAGKFRNALLERYFPAS